MTEKRGLCKKIGQPQIRIAGKKKKFLPFATSQKDVGIHQKF